jgi:hypothetical protein
MQILFFRKEKKRYWKANKRTFVIDEEGGGDCSFKRQQDWKFKLSSTCMCCQTQSVTDMFTLLVELARTLKRGQELSAYIQTFFSDNGDLYQSGLEYPTEELGSRE